MESICGRDARVGEDSSGRSNLCSRRGGFVDRSLCETTGSIMLNWGWRGRATHGCKRRPGARGGRIDREQVFQSLSTRLEIGMLSRFLSSKRLRSFSGTWIKVGRRMRIILVWWFRRSSKPLYQMIPRLSHRLVLRIHLEGQFGRRVIWCISKQHGNVYTFPIESSVGFMRTVVPEYRRFRTEVHMIGDSSRRRRSECRATEYTIVDRIFTA